MHFVRQPTAHAERKRVLPGYTGSHIARSMVLLLPCLPPDLDGPIGTYDDKHVNHVAHICIQTHMHDFVRNVFMVTRLSVHGDEPARATATWPQGMSLRDPLLAFIQSKSNMLRMACPLHARYPTIQLLVFKCQRCMQHDPCGHEPFLQ